MAEDNVKKRTNKVAVAGVICVVILVLLFQGSFLPIYHVRGFVCVHTGSSRGYREWAWGKKAKHWHRQSKLELFMREKHPGELEQKWVSYQGTGVNYFGKGVSSGHGDPGAVILVARNGVLDEYVDAIADSERKALYDLFASGDQEVISKKVREIQEWHAARPEGH